MPRQAVAPRKTRSSRRCAALAPALSGVSDGARSNAETQTHWGEGPLHDTCRLFRRLALKPACALFFTQHLNRRFRWQFSSRCKRDSIVGESRPIGESSLVAHAAKEPCDSTVPASRCHASRHEPQPFFFTGEDFRSLCELLTHLVDVHVLLGLCHVVVARRLWDCVWPLLFCVCPRPGLVHRQRFTEHVLGSSIPLGVLMRPILWNGHIAVARTTLSGDAKDHFRGAFSALRRD